MAFDARLDDQRVVVARGKISLRPSPGHQPPEADADRRAQVGRLDAYNHRRAEPVGRPAIVGTRSPRRPATGFGRCPGHPRRRGLGVLSRHTALEANPEPTQATSANRARSPDHPVLASGTVQHRHEHAGPCVAAGQQRPRVGIGPPRAAAGSPATVQVELDRPPTTPGWSMWAAVTWCPASRSLAGDPLNPMRPTRRVRPIGPQRPEYPHAFLHAPTAAAP